MIFATSILASEFSNFYYGSSAVPSQSSAASIPVTKFSLVTSDILNKYVIDDLALRGLIRTSYNNISGFDATSGKTNIIAIHLPPNVQVNYTNQKSFSALTCSYTLCGYNDVVQLPNGASVSYTVVTYPVATGGSKKGPAGLQSAPNATGCAICPSGNLAAQHEFMEAVTRAALKDNYNPTGPEIADYCDGYEGRYSSHDTASGYDYGATFHSMWSPLIGRCEPNLSQAPSGKANVLTGSKYSKQFYSFKLLSDPVPVQLNNCNNNGNYSTADFTFSTAWDNPATKLVFQFSNVNSNKWVKVFYPRMHESTFNATASGNLLFVTRPTGSYNHDLGGTISFSPNQGQITNCNGPSSNQLAMSLISQA